MKKFAVILFCIFSSLSACSNEQKYNEVSFKLFREYGITHFQSISYNYVVSDIYISEGSEYASGFVAIKHYLSFRFDDDLYFREDEFRKFYKIDDDLYTLISSFAKAKIFPFIGREIEGARYYIGDGCKILITEGLNKEEIIFSDKCYVSDYLLEQDDYVLKMSFSYEDYLDEYA